MLINKLWKTREIQAAFGIQAFRPGFFDTFRGQQGNPPGEMTFGNSQAAVDKGKNMLKTAEKITGFC